MSTGLIIAIVVIALILIALFAVILPRARRGAEAKARERELEQRREQRAGEHREEAAERRNQAEMAEQRARMAETEAQKERAEAEMREQRAEMHERGMADDELVDEHERDRFADVMSTPEDRDGDGHTMDDRARDMTHRDDNGDRMVSEGGAVSPEYQQGREDERRFERSRITDDVRDSDRTQR
jgi:FtsZ-interacting cell division protein ZipA